MGHGHSRVSRNTGVQLPVTPREAVDPQPTVTRLSIRHRPRGTGEAFTTVRVRGMRAPHNCHRRRAGAHLEPAPGCDLHTKDVRPTVTAHGEDRQAGWLCLGRPESQCWGHCACLVRRPGPGGRDGGHTALAGWRTCTADFHWARAPGSPGTEVPARRTGSCRRRGAGRKRHLCKETGRGLSGAFGRESLRSACSTAGSFPDSPRISPAPRLHVVILCFHVAPPF